MDRPKTMIELPNAMKVELYTYLTVKEKREVLREAKISDDTSNTLFGSILQDAILKRLLVSPLPGLDDMPSNIGDALYDYSLNVFIGKNALGDSKK